MSSRAPSGVFITGTGTGIGKTYVARGLTRAIAKSRTVAALKPIETGCEPHPMDALALARACGRPELANLPGLYRAGPAVSPYAATLSAGAPAPDLAAIVHAIEHIARRVQQVVVEGAGGLLVPVDPQHSMADLAARLGYPLLVVAPNELGVLSSAACCIESAWARGLVIVGLVLVEPPPERMDASSLHNRVILAERIPAPVLSFPHTPDDDDALATATEQAGLSELVIPGVSRET